MTLDEFLKRLKKESEVVDTLKLRNYFVHLDQLFKIIAYDGDRLNKKHNLMIAPYLQYIDTTRRNDFRDDLSKAELEEMADSLKTDIDCMIFRIEQKGKPVI